MELNEAWCETTTLPLVDRFTIENFGKLIVLIAEAKLQGYRFEVTYDSKDFINDRVSDPESKIALSLLPEWENLTQLEFMIRKCNEEKWPSMKTPLEKLREIMMRPMMENFAANYALQNGPFFTMGSTDTIYAFGLCGRSVTNIMLLTMIHTNNSSMISKP